MNDLNIPNPTTTDNDFLVGDTIFLKDGKTVLTVEHVWGDGCVWCHDGSMYESHEVEHATLEQIEASKRLIPSNNRELKSMGDDAHIENRVSPLCLSDFSKNDSQADLSIKDDALNRMESCYIEMKNKVLQLESENLQLSQKCERQAAEMVAMQVEIDLLRQGGVA